MAHTDGAHSLRSGFVTEVRPTERPDEGGDGDDGTSERADLSAVFSNRFSANQCCSGSSQGIHGRRHVVNDSDVALLVTASALFPGTPADESALLTQLIQLSRDDALCIWTKLNAVSAPVSRQSVPRFLCATPHVISPIPRDVSGLSDGRMLREASCEDVTLSKRLRWNHTSVFV
jgi:hypothetical protein